MASTELIGGGRQMRGCIGCGQTDDHPRDLVDVGAELPVMWHIDCHAHAGCEKCAEQVKDLPKGHTGSKMLGHIQKES